MCTICLRLDIWRVTRWAARCPCRSGSATTRRTPPSTGTVPAGPLLHDAPLKCALLPTKGETFQLGPRDQFQLGIAPVRKRGYRLCSSPFGAQGRTHRPSLAHTGRGRLACSCSARVSRPMPRDECPPSISASSGCPASAMSGSEGSRSMDPTGFGTRGELTTTHQDPTRDLGQAVVQVGSRRPEAHQRGLTLGTFHLDRCLFDIGPRVVASPLGSSLLLARGQSSPLVRL